MTPDELVHAYRTALAEVSTHVTQIHWSDDLGGVGIRLSCCTYTERPYYTPPCDDCREAVARAIELIEPHKRDKADAWRHDLSRLVVR